MAVGFAPSLANAILNHLTGRATWTAPAGVFVKLHTGDPGAAGTANAAAETTRKAVTFGTNASGGAISNTAQAQWTNYAAAETVSHFSLWDASTAGNFLWSGTLTTSRTMGVGDTLTFAVGDLDITLTPIAA